jgi:hypothetical protein
MDHFSVNGSLIQAWASLKSFKFRDDDQEPLAGKTQLVICWERNWLTRPMFQKLIPKRSFTTRGLTMNPRILFAVHLLTENRNGLVVVSKITEADGFAERDTVEAMITSIAPRQQRINGGR